MWNGLDWLVSGKGWRKCWKKNRKISKIARSKMSAWLPKLWGVVANTLWSKICWPDGYSALIGPSTNQFLVSWCHFKTIKSFIVFLFYRSTAVISIDTLLYPTWFVKLASFYGLGFIRYGDVSCFIWYFCSKSVINMLLSSFESTKKLSNQSEMPDLLANLVQPKLD